MDWLINIVVSVHCLVCVCVCVCVCVYVSVWVCVCVCVCVCMVLLFYQQFKLWSSKYEFTDNEWYICSNTCMYCIKIHNGGYLHYMGVMWLTRYIHCTCTYNTVIIHSSLNMCMYIHHTSVIWLTWYLKYRHAWRLSTSHGWHVTRRSIHHWNHWLQNF